MTPSNRHYENEQYDVNAKQVPPCWPCYHVRRQDDGRLGCAIARQGCPAIGPRCSAYLREIGPEQGA